MGNILDPKNMQDRTQQPPGVELKCFACGGNLSLQQLNGVWTLACFPLNVPCGPVLRNPNLLRLFHDYWRYAEHPELIPPAALVSHKKKEALKKMGFNPEHLNGYRP